MEENKNNDITDNTKGGILKNVLKNLSQFEPEEYFKKMMKEYGAFSCIIAGSRQSGKSVCLKYLYSILKKHFTITVVFSKTLINGFYSGFIDSKLIFDNYKPEVIDAIKKVAEKMKEKKKNVKILFIFDDCVDHKIKYEKNLNDLFILGRHYKFSVIFLTQKTSWMNTSMLSNCNIFISYFAGSCNERNYLARNMIGDCIFADKKYANLPKSAIERLAYAAQLEVCDDYMSLVCLPYEKQKIYTFRAKLISDKAARAKPLYEQFISDNLKKDFSDDKKGKEEKE